MVEFYDIGEGLKQYNQHNGDAQKLDKMHRNKT